MRETILLSCGDCKRKNYAKTKNKKTHPDKMVIKKFCSSCRKHTEHKETKA